MVKQDKCSQPNAFVIHKGLGYFYTNLTFQQININKYISISLNSV